MSLLPPYSIVPSAAPTDLYVAHKDSSSVSLSWKPPPADHHNGQLIGYTVEIKDVNGVSQQASKHTDNTFITIDDLNSDTEYKFHVSARTAAGSGPTTAVWERTAEGGKGYLSENITVESHDYAPPPLCILALSKSGEGAYRWDPNISM